MIRVIVADDQELVRSGLRIMLEQQDDIEVCGEAATGSQAVELARTQRPDLALLDIRMPKVDGLEATRRIVRDTPETRVLILTTYDLDEYVAAALRDGACGFLLKDAAPADLIAAVRSAALGDLTLGRGVLRRLVTEFIGRAPAAHHAGVDLLSEREREVLRGLARGLSNAEIAGELVVSPATVKTHVANVLAKLGARDRVQAVIIAYESGFARQSGR